MFAKRGIERFYSQKLEWNRSILVDSPTKRTLIAPVGLGNRNSEMKLYIET
jgi:hypothetical protein